MEKLKINIDGVEKTIDFTDRIAKGIFIVSENNLVKRNCKILQIELGTPENDLHLLQKVTKFGKTGILTTFMRNVYFQYIIMPSAERRDFIDLRNMAPPAARDPLTHAYNLRKMDTLGDLDFLGGHLDQNN